MRKQRKPQGCKNIKRKNRGIKEKVMEEKFKTSFFGELYLLIDDLKL